MSCFWILILLAIHPLIFAPLHHIHIISSNETFALYYSYDLLQGSFLLLQFIIWKDCVYQF